MGYFSNRKELTKANKRRPQGMGHGLDVCMGDPREARTIEECLESEFVRTLVCQAGLVISGHKPAAVFGFTPRAWRRRRWQEAGRRGRASDGGPRPSTRAA